MPNYPIQYRERQRITAKLLRDQQQTHLDNWRSHRTTLHSWGIVEGLRVERLGKTGILVGPGSAIDQSGRVLLIRSPREIAASKLREAASRCGAADRGETKLILGLRIASWRDQDFASRREIEPQIVVAKIISRGDSSSMVCVSEVNPIPADFDPLDTGADLVPLSGLRLGDSTIALPPFHHLSGLVGSFVLAPLGNTRLVIGSDPLDDLRRFGVAVPDEHGRLADYRFSLDRNARCHLKGPVTIEGDLRLRAASGQLQTGKLPRTNHVAQFGPIALPEDDPPPPRPWSIYRLPAAAGSVPSLRVELENLGKDSDPDGRVIQFGTTTRNPNAKKSNSSDTSAQPARPAFRFRPFVRAQTDGKLFVSPQARPTDDTTDSDQTATERQRFPTIRVTGLIREGPIRADLQDPRFAQRVWKESVAGKLYLTFEGPPQFIHSTEKNTTRLIYTIRIRNSGLADLSGIQVHQNVYKPPPLDQGFAVPLPNEPTAVDGPPANQEQNRFPQFQVQVASGIRLRSGEPAIEVRVDKVFPRLVNASGAKTLSVLVFGAAAVGSVVYAIEASAIVETGEPTDDE